MQSKLNKTSAIQGDGQPDSVDALPLIAAMAAATEQTARVDAWLMLCAWIRTDVRPQGKLLDPDLTGGWQVATPGRDRFSQLIDALASDPDLAARFRESLALMIATTDLAAFFSRTGMPSDRGFVSEALDRVLVRVLPRPRADSDLTRMLRRMFPDEAGAIRLQQSTPERFARLLVMLDPQDGSKLWDEVERGFADGFRLLAVRAQTHGLSPAIRGSRVGEAVVDSPFFRLATTSLALAETWNSSTGPGELDTWRLAVAACQAQIDGVHERLQVEGVAIDAVFSISLIRSLLARMELMVAIQAAVTQAERSDRIRRLMVRMVAHAQVERSVRHLVRTHLGLLHQKIVERSSETGGHYIASDRAEYRHIWFAAAGGGVLTAGTSVVKTLVHHLAHAVHLPLFVEGLGYSLNYAASFVILQHAGLMLATKQPAMTAAALARSIRDTEGEARLTGIVDQVARICHSQVAAVTANVALVAAGAWAFNSFFYLGTGRNWLSAEEAAKVYTSMSVADSLTPFYAALTGVILWLSSLAGGTFDNWSARHRIADGIADIEAPEWIGKPRLLRWGVAWRKHAAGWGTNISLGFMLGFTPVLGTILGVPLDVRHVTLSSGILSLAVSGTEDGWMQSGLFIYALAGVATMFVLNLSVSFGLSLFTALRAFEMEWTEVATIVRAVAQRMITKPHHFLMPFGPASGARQPHH